MKAVCFRPCPKCGRLCSTELEMCEVCSAKIAESKTAKQMRAVEPVPEEKELNDNAEMKETAEDSTKISEAIKADESIVAEATEAKGTLNESTLKPSKIKLFKLPERPNLPKTKGVNGFYSIIAVLMAVIIVLVTVIIKDKRKSVAVGNNASSGSSALTESSQEMINKDVIEIIESDSETDTPLSETAKGINSDRETTTKKNTGNLIKETTTKKNTDNSIKGTTTKKNTGNSIKETTTKKTTATTTAASKIEFNPEIVYPKGDVFRIDLSQSRDAWFADVQLTNCYIVKQFDQVFGLYEYYMYITVKFLKLYDFIENPSFELIEIPELKFETIKDTEIIVDNFDLCAYNGKGELYSRETFYMSFDGEKIKPGYSFTIKRYLTEYLVGADNETNEDYIEVANNIEKYVLEAKRCEKV